MCGFLCCFRHFFDIFQLTVDRGQILPRVFIVGFEVDTVGVLFGCSLEVADCSFIVAVECMKDAFSGIHVLKHLEHVVYAAAEGRVGIKFYHIVGE